MSSAILTATRSSFTTPTTSLKGFGKFLQTQPSSKFRPGSIKTSGFSPSGSLDLLTRVVLALSLTIRKFALTHLHEFYYSDGPKQVEWPWRTAMRSYKNKRFHQINKRNIRQNKALVHSLQDVFTTIAAAFYTGATILFPDVNRFPLVNNLLELCWAKCPTGMSFTRLLCQELWVLDDEVRSPSNRLYSQSEVQWVQAARQQSKSLDLIICLKLKSGPEKSCVDGLLKAKDVNLRDSRLRLWSNCQNCASKFDKTEGCPFPPKPCQYPYC